MPQRVIVVTGANSGIGFGMTQALLDLGDRVAALDIASERLAELRVQHLDLLRVIRCDVTIRPQVEMAVAEVLDAWQRIDILVNTACLALFCEHDRRSLADTRREFEVNYFGYLNMIDAVLPHMKARRCGVIHNVGSSVGLSGFPGVSGYASTKGAIEALSRTLAMELARHGICVNLVHPPLTRTPSSAPLGVPSRFMADPMQVGARLARRVGSRASLVTPDALTWLGVVATRVFPDAMGRFLGGRAARAGGGQGRVATPPPSG
jgi:NAD(P)-dependent dehydrogenase (short-subunit alcohol dehydrogenase family)